MPPCLVPGSALGGGAVRRRKLAGVGLGVERGTDRRRTCVCEPSNTETPLRSACAGTGSLDSKPRAGDSAPGDQTWHLTTRLNCAYDLGRRRSATAAKAVDTSGWNAVDGQGAVSAVRLGAWRTLLVDSRRLGGCDRRPRPVAEWARRPVCEETTRFRWEAILPDIRHRRTARWGHRTERRVACV